MSLPYPLRFYHSYRGNDSYLSSYTCRLQDGGLLIAQAVQKGVELIVSKDKNENSILIPVSSTHCAKE